MHVASFLISLALIALLFALIYKVLPDTSLAWRDVIIGAAATAILFEAGKFLISLYLGSSSATSSFGAAGALALLLLWIYYSSQIFLFGAEFTRAWADLVHGRGPDTANEPLQEDAASKSTTTTTNARVAKAPSHDAKLRALKADLERERAPRR
jgi:membrane protein